MLTNEFLYQDLIDVAIATSLPSRVMQLTEARH